MEATSEDKIIRSDIFDFKPIRRWSKGRVALLGDAAHASTPNLGQGGCQAVEDAYVIAQCLAEEKSIEGAFERYQAIRYQKATNVVNTSWRFSQMTNLASPVLQHGRNGLLRIMPEWWTFRELEKVYSLNY